MNTLIISKHPSIHPHMIRLDRQPTALDLRLFGGSLAMMLSLFGFFAWRLDKRAVATGLWIAAAVLCAVYYAAPRVRKPLYRAWIVAMFPLAWLMSALVLGILFFGLITPIGWLSRLAGRDPLQLQTRRASYGLPRPESPPPKSRYFRQH